MITRSADESNGRVTDRKDTVTGLLADICGGRREALDDLFHVVYDELRELAHRQRRHWNGNETLNTTALVHEAYLKLVDQRGSTWDSEAHFLAAAARAIRHILIGGMTIEQTALVLRLSTPTVVRGWAMAQAWLRGTLVEARAS